MPGWEAIQPWLADLCVLVGVLVMSVGVHGLVTAPDLYAKLHAVGTAVVFGAVLVALASLVTGDIRVISRVILISAMLLLTAPVSGHVIARAGWLEGEPVGGDNPVDESGPSRPGQVTG